MRQPFAGSAYSQLATTGSIATAISTDGSIASQPAQSSSVTGSGVNMPTSFAAMIVPTEGFHDLTIVGHTSISNNGQWNVAGESLLSATVIN
jgi:hypothetical protein